MILTSLTLDNFGLFRGSQTLHLAPHPSRPIVLLGGKNGAGKSTLFEAIRLCLYGQAALGSRLSREEYLHYLDTRIHPAQRCLFSLPTLQSPSNFSTLTLKPCTPIG